jgi:RimJ/RimL family protein N-acetyltransferase
MPQPAPESAPAKYPLPASARLRLREFRPSDRDDIIRMHQDARVRALLVDDMPMDRPLVAWEFIRRIQALYRAQEGLGIWCAERRVVLMSDDEAAQPEVQETLTPEAIALLQTPRWNFAGWFNLMQLAQQAGEIEIGCRLVPEAWGGGLAMDGGEMLLDYAFDTLKYPRVWGICHPDHRSVHAILRALGFGEPLFQPYEGVPAAHFVIGRADWLAAREQPRRMRLRQAVRAAAKGVATRFKPPQ